MIIKNRFTNRRGLSSIVGALFFVVLMVSAFAVLGVALNSQTDIASTGRDVAATDLKKSLEEFRLDVSGVGDPAELFISVENVGQNPVEISTVIVAEITKKQENYPVNQYDIPANLSYIPPGKKQQILPDDTVYLDLADPATTGIDPELYTIKVISTLGTIKTWTITCDENACGELPVAPGAGSLSATLFLDGPNGVNTKTSTVVMFVTNTSDETILNVQPKRGFDLDPNCDGTGFWIFDTSGTTSDDFAEGITNCSVTPSVPQTLLPHEVTIFKWDFTVHGDIGAEFTFCNRAQGDDAFSPPPVESSHGTNCINPVEQGTTDSLTVIDPNDCNGCGPEGGEGGESVFLIDDLLIRPSLFLTIPSPFGSVPSAGSSDSESGFWGVQVANPLNATMTISKVTLTAFVPGANANLKIFDPTLKNHNVSPRYTGIPDDDGSWISNAENTLVWKNFTDPIILAPFSTETFMYRANPWSNSVDLEAIIVQTSVFSTFGSFGKGAYQTTMFPAGGSNDAPIANVYLAKEKDTRDSAKVLGHLNNIVNGSSPKFIAVMSDMDANTDSYIAQGSELIINVPRDWGVPSIISANTTNVFCCNSTHPSITKHDDGSYQIIGILDKNIGTAGVNSASVGFTTEAPNKFKDQLYPMYILGNGLTNTGTSSVGPLQEAILHVYGNATGAIYNP